MLPAVPSELVWTIYACVLIPKMIWRSLFCGSAFTGVGDVQIWHNLWYFWWLWCECFISCIVAWDFYRVWRILVWRSWRTGLFWCFSDCNNLTSVFAWFARELMPFRCWWMFRDDCASNSLGIGFHFLHVLRNALHENDLWRIHKWI